MGAQGIEPLNFGAFPGGFEASVVITGQAWIVAGSLVEAWIRLEATADHSVDEHMLETIRVTAGNIVPGTGFTIYGFNSSTLPEPIEHGPRGPSAGGQGTRIYGLWNVAWGGN